MKYDIISPDGFSIKGYGSYFASIKAAWRFFDKWKERFTQQGYYSSNKGRIPLDELKDNCTLQPITK